MLVLFGQIGSIWANWFYLSKRGFIWAKGVVFGKKRLYLGKLVLLGQVGSSWANWFYLGKFHLFGQVGSIWANWFYLGKLVLFGKKWFYLGKRWFYLGKSGCIWANCF